MTTVIETPKDRTERLPTTMTAEAIDRFGPPEVLTPHTVPVPKVGPSDVLIALHGAGVGIWDAKIRDGTWAPEDISFPLVLGTDGAGIVVAKGTRVRRFELGDRVYAYSYLNPKGGFYAQYVAVTASHVGHVPEQLDLLQMGTAGVVGLTALQGIDDHLHVRAQDSVLIFGGSGAVGTHAIQFAKRHHARVITTASGRDAQQLVRDLGADAVIDARNPSEIDQLSGFAPHGLDAVLATAGGDALERCLEHVHPGGRVAYPDGVEPEPKHRRQLRIVKYDAVPGTHEFARYELAIVETKLRVVIAETFPLERAADSHRRLERGHVLGRIALQIRG
jgi:NADPH2:quinone reductase